MERLPGFRDFYPEPLPAPDAWSADLRTHIFDRWRESARRYAFREYDGPPLEELELYTTKSGAEIVGQLYNFTDKGERTVALRPEMTPTLARMIAAAERSYKKPIKWFAIPQLFRYERHQKGRLREHFQFNADIFGENSPAADAELISLLIDTLRSFGLTSEDFAIRLSSRNAWQDFFTAQGGVPEKAYDFFQIVDKLDREEIDVTSARLRDLGLQLEQVQRFIAEAKPTSELDEVIRNLSARKLEPFIQLDYGIIRGLAYYTGIVFEAFDRKGAFRAIAGGGRYNNLVKLISGGKVDLPALGFGMGDVVLAELLKQRKLVPVGVPALDAFCLIEQEDLRAPSLELVQTLREAGFSVDYSMVPAKSDKQFKRAQELNAACTIRVAHDNGQLTAHWRNLRARTQGSSVPGDLLPVLREQLRTHSA